MESMRSLLVLALIGLVAGSNVRVLRAAQADVEALRKAIPGEPGKDYPIHSIDILRKINPGMFGGARQAPGRSGGAPSPAAAAPSQPRTAKQSGQDNPRIQGFKDQVSQGIIPGTPGKDYPINSLDALKKKNPSAFGNLKPAPAHLITPDYPLKGGQLANLGPNNAPPLALVNNEAGAQSGAKDYCPGGSVGECKNFCPPEEDRVVSACHSSCEKRCS